MVDIFGDPGAATLGRYDISGQKVFRAKFYIKSARAPGHLPLPNQFQKSLNSFPLIGQRNIFLPNISTRRPSRATLAFLFEVVFLTDRSSYLVRTTGRFLWRWFQKKDSIKPWKSQAVTWVQRNNTRRLIFTVDFNSETFHYVRISFTRVTRPNVGTIDQLQCTTRPKPKIPYQYG